MGDTTPKLATVIVLLLMVLTLAVHGADNLSEDSLRVINASEILAKIHKGELVEYSNVIVKDDLDVSQLRLQVNVTSPIRINNSIFDGFVNFSYTSFDKPINLSSSNFTKSAYFGGATFNGVTTFWNSTFSGPADFGGAIFNSNVDFWELVFNDDTNFWASVFNGNVDFSGSAFNGTAYFEGATFNSGVDFLESVFNGPTYFRDSVFNGDTNFWYSVFNGPADFGESVFNTEADFSGSAFNGPAYFGKAVFNGDADFRNSVFNGVNFWKSVFNGFVIFWYSVFNGKAEFGESVFNSSVDFSGSVFNGPAKFWKDTFNKEVNFNDVVLKGNASFDNSQFKEDALFENTTFQRKLSLIKTRYYNKLFIRWHNISGGLVYDDAAYLSLLKNFKDLGYLEDYDSCYFAYRKEHRGQPWPAIGYWEAKIRKVIDYPLELFYGYGTKPLDPLGWSALTVLLFGAIWRIGGLKEDKYEARLGIFEKYGSSKICVSKNRSLSRNWWRELRILAEVMIFSATVFLSGTRFFIEPPALPKMPRFNQSQINAAFTAERIFGAFFSILFFFAMGATIVR